MKNRSTGNHQSSKDWNDLELALQNQTITTENRLLFVRFNFVCSKDIIPCYEKHPPKSENFILDSRIHSLKHRTKIYLINWRMIVKA